jgi:hypothetical protein
MFVRRNLPLIAAFLGICLPAFASAASLHEEIDRLVAASADGPLAARSSDAEFCRRVSLDLSGCIPSPAAVRAFLEDSDPQKRTKLIDRLLQSPEFARRMQEVTSVMLLDRREGKAIDDDAWNEWLRSAFVADKPWNQLVRELIAADGTEERTRPAIRFFVDGGRTDAHLLTQDVARIFLGVSWQCAQCHDHPAFTDYKQSHYFGLYAFLNASKVYTDKQSRSFLVEGVTKTKIEFVSVFMPDDKRNTGPNLLGMSEVKIPHLPTGEEFETKPKDGHPGVPRFRPRALLAERLTHTSNRMFARNAVNRFWFFMIGRGLVHPLDLHHSANPPSHPELLEKLTDAFIERSFDVRRLLREIALSETYQRSGELTSKVTTSIRPERLRVAIPKPLSAEQMARSLAEATGHRATLDSTPSPKKSQFTYKDYVNGRLPTPDNWKDLQILFGAVFGHPAGQPEIDFRPSVEQSLFLSNDRLMSRWLEDSTDRLVDRLRKIEEPAGLADELYLTVLSRMPTSDERTEVGEFLKSASVRRNAVVDLCRALLTSAEFRMNH